LQNQLSEGVQRLLDHTIRYQGPGLDYRDSRWVTPPEALWGIYDFELSQISPPVKQLQLHLPNKHMVAFHERQMVERVVNRPGVDRSMLTTYFEANRLHEEAHGILYCDFPEWYTWQSGKGKVWQRRKRDTGGQVDRIVSAHPAEGERYYLRVLLNHVTGAASYVDLRTVDGVTLPTFREAAERRGLLESDNTDAIGAATSFCHCWGLVLKCYELRTRQHREC
jgi:ATP-dependent DNA helicase PIF1